MRPLELVVDSNRLETTKCSWQLGERPRHGHREQPQLAPSRHDDPSRPHVVAGPRQIPPYLRVEEARAAHGQSDPERQKSKPAIARAVIRVRTGEQLRD